jgi:hypothetical protein
MPNFDVIYERVRVLLLLIALIQVMGCKEPYDPSLETGVQDYLIVEGVINADGVTSIQLSRSVKLAEAGLIKYEDGASLQIETDNNTIYPLIFKEKGLYQSAELNLNPINKYRLRIKTPGGDEYLSDFTEVGASPDLEVVWDQQDDGVRIYANSEDLTGQTNYYQWTYEETWEVKSVRLSLYEVKKTFPLISIIERPLEEIEELLVCWANDTPTNILTSSTTTLIEDRVNRFPLVFIPNGSDRLSIRYSILVRQYAISREAYEFLELMKKNSEQMGSLFDPMPSTIRGNIHNLQNPDKPAVGYIIAVKASEKRVFITSEEAGNWQDALLCPEVSLRISDVSALEKHFRNSESQIADMRALVDLNGNEYMVWLIYPAICLDCRLRGEPVKPDFW